MRSVPIYGLITGLWLTLCACNMRYGVHQIDRVDSHVIDREVVLQAINEELEKAPDDQVLLKRKVNFLEDQNWPEESESAIMAALEAIPDDGELHYQASLFYFSRDRLQEAKESLIEAGKLGYLTADYFLNYAQVLFRMGEEEEAFDLVSRFQNLDPENYRSHLLKGRIYLEQRDTIAAIGSLRKAFSMERGDDALNLQLIDLLVGNKDSLAYEEVLAQVPRKDEGWKLKVALIKRSYSLYDEFINDLYGIIAINPDFFPAILYLSDIYYETFQYDSALRYAGVAIEKDSLNLRARLISARSLDKQYRYQRAIDEYESLLVMDSTYDNAREELISVYRKVAYLRRLREEKESIPEFNFAPIKKKEVNTNN